MDLLFKNDNQICNIRAAGILLYEDQILLQEDGGEYALPGGHVKFFETAEEAVQREFSEELGVTVKAERLLFTEESFWEWNGRKTHTICFYYLLSAKDGYFSGKRTQLDNERISLSYLPINELKNITVYPRWLAEKLEHPEEAPVHIVAYD